MVVITNRERTVCTPVVNIHTVHQRDNRQLMGFDRQDPPINVARPRFTCRRSARSSRHLSTPGSSPYYEGWTFTKAKAELPSGKKSWNRAYRLPMDLNQHQLSKQVKSKARTCSHLRELQKGACDQVNQLIEDRNQEDNPRFEWSLASIHTVERLIKVKGSCSPASDIISIEVILERKLQNNSSLGPVGSESAVDLESPAVHNQRASIHFDRVEEKYGTRQANIKSSGVPGWQRHIVTAQPMPGSFPHSPEAASSPPEDELQKAERFHWRESLHQPDTFLGRLFELPYREHHRISHHPRVVQEHP